jgi:hypothetical protein
MGLDRDSASTLGRKEFIIVVENMAPAYERWAAVWLTQTQPAAGVHQFSGHRGRFRVAASGIPQLVAVVGSFRKDEWGHQGLALQFTEALASCWTKLQPQVEQRQELRRHF